jgi:FkbM family methyltransferase
MKYIVKWIFKLIGLNITKKYSDDNPVVLLCKSLNNLGVECVFDIGANTGQFASELRRCGYKGKIISFEPLPREHFILLNNSKNDPLWIVHDRVAIGANETIARINVSKNSVSSSILPMLESHKVSAPNSQYIESTEVNVVTLDAISKRYLNDKERFFIKIDTQGYESFVIDGAEESLKEAMGIICELSLIPLYEGQILWLEMIDRLNQKGFNLWAMQSRFYDSKSGRTLQIDATFHKHH